MNQNINTQTAIADALNSIAKILESLKVLAEPERALTEAIDHAAEVVAETEVAETEPVEHFVLEAADEPTVEEITPSIGEKEASESVEEPAVVKQDVKLYKSNTSGFRGVSWRKNDRNWKATCVVNGKRWYKGGFKTPEEAHVAVEAQRAKMLAETESDNHDSTPSKRLPRPKCVVFDKETETWTAQSSCGGQLWQRTGFATEGEAKIAVKAHRQGKKQWLNEAKQISNVLSAHKTSETNTEPMCSHAYPEQEADPGAKVYAMPEPDVIITEPIAVIPTVSQVSSLNKTEWMRWAMAAVELKASKLEHRAIGVDPVKSTLDKYILRCNDATHANIKMRLYMEKRREYAAGRHPDRIEKVTVYDIIVRDTKLKRCFTELLMRDIDVHSKLWEEMTAHAKYRMQKRKQKQEQRSAVQIIPA